VEKKLLSSRETRQLLAAILQLNTLDEAAAFFADIGTAVELKSLAQRLEVARLLQTGATYSQIEGQTGVSTATISRVKRFLQYGAGGYGLILQRLHE
jgi:TrpR-related protein YerC/YecD